MYIRPYAHQEREILFRALKHRHERLFKHRG